MLEDVIGAETVPGGRVRNNHISLLLILKCNVGVNGFMVS